MQEEVGVGEEGWCKRRWKEEDGEGRSVSKEEEGWKKRRRRKAGAGRQFQQYWCGLEYSGNLWEYFWKKIRKYFFNIACVDHMNEILTFNKKIDKG